MKKRNPPNPGTPLSLRKRLGRNPDVRAFLEARFREAWTGSDFEIGTIVLVLEAVGQQFGPERAPSAPRYMTMQGACESVSRKKATPLIVGRQPGPPLCSLRS